MGSKSNFTSRASKSPGIRAHLRASALARIVLALCISFSVPAENTSGSVLQRLAQPGIVEALAQSSTTRQSSPQRHSRHLHNRNHESPIRNIVQRAGPLKPGNHTSNVAVLVSSSRYWFNYRHVTNTLSIYHLLRRGGIPDENIILMLADDIPCNMRNPFRGKIYPRGANGGAGEDLMENVEIDYYGTDVTVDAFLRTLVGRHLPGEGGHPGISRRSLPKLDENTNVLVYLSGHGGDNFFKFQDGEELTSADIASAFSQMYELRRYKEILFISDTCQAFTMADEINSPNVFSVGSSLKGQNSYASHSDPEIGQSVIDRYSKAIKDFVDDAVMMLFDNKKNEDSALSGVDVATSKVMGRLNLLDALVRIPMNYGQLGSNSKVGYSDKLCSRKMNQVPLSDFFAAPPGRRQGKSNQHMAGISTSLWMPNILPTGETEVLGRTQQPLSGECTVSLKSTQAPANDDSFIQQSVLHDRPLPPQKSRNESPYNLKFVLVVLGFLLCIRGSFRVW